MYNTDLETISNQKQKIYILKKNFQNNLII